MLDKSFPGAQPSSEHGVYQQLTRYGNSSKKLQVRRHCGIAEVALCFEKLGLRRRRLECTGMT